MSRQAIRGGIVLLVLVTLSTSLFIDVRPTASASALSVGPRGLFVARRYLEERGVRVRLLDRPLDEAEPSEVLVLAFPWQRWAGGGEQAGLQQHLLRGGTLALGYSGSRESRGEQDAMDWLGLSWDELREEPPLGFFAWRAHTNEEWSLTPTDSAGSGPIRVSAVSHAPRAPAGAKVLGRAPGGKPLVFEFSFLKGRVLVLPAEALSNARIQEGGNADLLESLARSLGPTWSFDEYHHGLSAPMAEDQLRPLFAFDLFLLHLAILYGLAVWRLARSFGPVWSEQPVVSGSTRSFLLGLGTLHDKLRHHREGAELLLRRARELQPRIELPENPTAGSGAELVRLASAVARAQSK